MNKKMTKIEKWDVEDRTFWETTGKHIAYKNLWISIGCLLLAFCVWLMWSIITVQMRNLGFPFDDEQLFTLSAIAGLIGATLRIPSSFLVAISGGRNINFVYTGLLIIPAFFTGVALQNKETPYFIFVILAGLSGIGGGLFAPSMSNISLFFPKKIQGLALGLNAGLGNLGVSVMQIVLPFVMSFAIFGVLGGSGFTLPSAYGENAMSNLVYIQNAGFTWVPFLVVFSLAALLLMDNHPIYDIGNNLFAILKAFGPLMVGFISSAIGLYLLLVLNLNMFIVLPVTIILTMLFMRISPQSVRKSLNNQFQIFKNKHTWIMTILYTMSFGSFIGFSAALPLFIKVIFGVLPDGSVNPSAPNPFHYAWLGPLVGSLFRPFGGWLADKISGSKVNHINILIMILATIGVAYFVKQAEVSQNPEHLFVPFLILFLILFVTTGIGNGSNFRIVPVIFEQKLAGPVLGWISAIAAYGAFLVPSVIGTQVKANTPEYALYGFAFFYVFCLVLNWWFYVRKSAEVKC